MAHFTTDKNYATLTLDEVVNFLDAYASDEQKHEFKTVCYTKKAENEATGEIEMVPCKNLNWFAAKLWFCKTFAPELVPVAQPRGKKSSRIQEW